MLSFPGLIRRYLKGRMCIWKWQGLSLIVLRECVRMAGLRNELYIEYARLFRTPACERLHKITAEWFHPQICRPKSDNARQKGPKMRSVTLIIIGPSLSKTESVRFLPTCKRERCRLVVWVAFPEEPFRISTFYISPQRNVISYLARMRPWSISTKQMPR